MEGKSITRAVFYLCFDVINLVLVWKYPVLHSHSAPFFFFLTQHNLSAFSLVLRFKTALRCTSSSVQSSNWNDSKLLGLKTAERLLNSSSDLGFFFFKPRSSLKEPLSELGAPTHSDIKVMKYNGKTRACPFCGLLSRRKRLPRGA